jgi:ribonuclease HII
MRRAATLLCVAPGHALIDGRDVPPGLPCTAQALVKGDQRSQSIAAASIVAKVTRDRMMTRCAAVHTAYGFDLHMGYATARHRSAIVSAGAVARIHRMSFAPLKAGAVEADGTRACWWRRPADRATGGRPAAPRRVPG